MGTRAAIKRQVCCDRDRSSARDGPWSEITPPIVESYLNTKRVFEQRCARVFCAFTLGRYASQIYC